VRRRWSELSPRARRVIVIAGTADAVLRAVALADLARRPADAVRGSKRSWAAAVGLVSSAGAVPIAYLVLGRRRTSGR
jgi:hypothetical protein